MAKLSFTISHDCRIDGKVVKAGSKYDLDPQDPKDANTIATLRASGRIVGDIPETVNLGSISTPQEPAKEK